ncbi:hypothetical protein [Deinococcus sp. SL84]|uniref:hypothetical protein n=1 Tax=Deinococcus sp. SL84 TaxID=2994663 RepID=UPI0022767343|nr:hypothetical protein [Deinococcus sp. SL84]MCY1703878.1 hypothetical protein [Deinococcus sp. SL84]
MNVHPYTPVLLGSVLGTFILTGLTEPNLALGLGLGLMASVVAYRSLEHWHSPTGHSELRRVLLSLNVLVLCVMVSGPQSTFAVITALFLTFSALILARTLQPPQGAPGQGVGPGTPQEAGHAR